jgi:hypothetical protein
MQSFFSRSFGGDRRFALISLTQKKQKAPGVDFRGLYKPVRSLASLRDDRSFLWAGGNKQRFAKRIYNRILTVFCETLLIYPI